LDGHLLSYRPAPATEWLLQLLVVVHQFRQRIETGNQRRQGAKRLRHFAQGWREWVPFRILLADWINLVGHFRDWLSQKRPDLIQGRLQTFQARTRILLAPDDLKQFVLDPSQLCSYSLEGRPGRASWTTHIAS
jgi:hypothetical protein